jgi:hypothetical protein
MAVWGLGMGSECLLRLDNRKSAALAGLLAAKDAVDVGRCLPININIIAAASGATDATRGLCIPPAVCTQPGS